MDLKKIITAKLREGRFKCNKIFVIFLYGQPKPYHYILDEIEEGHIFAFGIS